jgi:hypothetical protein
MYRRLAKFTKRYNVPLVTGAVGYMAGSPMLLPGAAVGGGVAGLRNAFDKTSTEEEKSTRLRNGLIGGAAVAGGVGALGGGYLGYNSARRLNKKYKKAVDDRVIDDLLS